MLIGRQVVNSCVQCLFCKPSTHATRLYSFCIQGGFEPQPTPPAAIPATCPFSDAVVQRAFAAVKAVDYTEGRD